MRLIKRTTQIILWCAILAALNLGAQQKSCAQDNKPIANNKLVTAQLADKKIPTISPGDVFLSVQQIKRLIEQVYSSPISSRNLLTIEGALPRTNYLLAFELYVLSMAIQQKEEQVFYVPEIITFPPNIEPKDVYYWVHRTLTLWQCRTNLPLPSNQKNSMFDSIDPSDVSYQLIHVIRLIKQELDQSIIDSRITSQLIRTEYLLQDILLTLNLRPVVNSELKQKLSAESFETLLHESLMAIERVNGVNYIKDRAPLIEQGTTQKYEYRLVALELLLGELIFFNHTTTNVAVPPDNPMLNYYVDETMLVVKVANILSMLTVLETHLGGS